MATRKAALIYKTLLFVASVVFIYLILKQLGSLQKAAETLSLGSWYFILPIIGIQILAVVNRGAFYHTLYEYFSVKDTLWRHIKMSLAANFANLAAPSGGLAGMTIFIAEAKRHGMTKSRSTFVNFFAYFLYYGVFTLILLFGLFYLVLNHQLYKYQIVTASILFGMIFLLVLAAVMVFEEAARLNKLFSLIAQVINFFTKFFNKRSVLSDSSVTILSKEIHSCLTYIQKRWKALWLPVFHVLLIEAIDIMTLYYLFLAFEYPIYPGTLITAYAISVLFTFISITPGGIGVVEAAMIFVLTNLKVPVELAAVAVFSFRIITYWIPFGLGFLTFRSIQNEKINSIENGSS
ncbi:MAG: lysylphosphatidylglycerol synthase transmembrane domain-containing protein [bacterium]